MTIVMLAVLIVVTMGVAVPVELAPNEYRGRAIVSFSPRRETLSGDLLQVLTTRYVAFLTAPATTREIARETGEREGELRRAVSITQEPGTANVVIDATLGEPSRAARVANAMAAAALREAVGDAAVVAEITAPAVVPTVPDGPPRRLLELTGLTLGLVLAVLAGALWQRWWRWRASGEMSRSRRPGSRDTEGEVPTAPQPRHEGMPSTRPGSGS